ncbi:MAG: ATP-binding cassette domain-containing protein, partial [Spirochaetales bacterium]|nr:ATP-binding cassette domain-containing protein [Spirochaetales bacterium]
MSTVISVNNLSKNFRLKTKGQGLGGAAKSIFKPAYLTVKAVTDISFEVEKGDILAFIGPNGAGKSTTIKLITGILFPDNGTISVLGMNPHKDRKKLAYRIGTVFGQKSQLWYHLPPSDSFHLLGSIYDVPRELLEQRIE